MDGATQGRLRRQGSSGGRRASRAFLALAALAAAPRAAVAQDGEPEARPHIVFILIDDLGWNNLSCMPGAGSRAFATPHIDGLAAESLVFHHAYANAPNCAPSRAALMSGMWAQRTGVYTVHSASRGRAQDRALVPVPNREELAGEVVTLAEVLKGAGYTTLHIGKWHLGGGERHLPQAQGFDVNVAGDETGMPHPGYFDAEGVHLSRRLTDEAIGLLRRHAEQGPMFLYMSYYAVHSPYEPELAFGERARARLGEGRRVSPDFAGLVDGVDAHVGRILATLDDLGIADDTLVVLSSDNGGPGDATHQRPLRGYKGMYCEGGLRVPLMLRWPGRIARGSRSDEPVQLFDLYPTLAAIAGAQLPTEQPVDGVDLSPLLLGEADSLAQRALYWHFPAYLQAMRKLDGCPRAGWRATPCSVIREGRWKLTEYFEEQQPAELYDLELDPSEERNLAAHEPQRLRALQQRLADWREVTQAPVPTEANPAYGKGSAGGRQRSPGNRER